MNKHQNIKLNKIKTIFIKKEEFIFDYLNKHIRIAEIISDDDKCEQKHLNFSFTTVCLANTLSDWHDIEENKTSFNFILDAFNNAISTELKSM